MFSVIQNATRSSDQTREKQRERREDKDLKRAYKSEFFVFKKDAHVCSDVPRYDAVHLNVLLAPFVAERLRHLAQRAFRSGVRRNGQASLDNEGKKTRVGWSQLISSGVILNHSVR